MGIKFLFLSLTFICFFSKGSSQVSVSIGPQEVVNEAVGQLELNITLSSADVNSTVYVQLSVRLFIGSANYSDFSLPNGTLEFPPGTSQQAVNLTIIDDNIVEQYEFFGITAKIINGTTSPEIFITIQDNDVLTIGFVQVEYTYSETDAVADVCVDIFNGAADRQIDFRVATSLGNASDVFDYAPFIFEEAFTMGSSQGICVPITLLPDSIVENTEFFYVNLITNGDVITNGRDVAKVYITDVNGAVLRVVNSTGDPSSMLTVPEGNTNSSFPVCVQLVSGGELNPVTQNSGLERDVQLTFYSTTVTADGSDFVPEANILLSLPGGTVDGEVVCVNVTIIGDTIHEADEQFNFTFTADNPSDSFQNGGFGVVIIMNDDVVDCGNLQSPTNGLINFTSTTFNNTASYSCDTGYELVGNQTRTCLTTGNWSGSEPFCNAVDCGELQAPANGVIDATSTTFNTTATYSCVIGYELVGNQTRTCLANGNWSNTEPGCQAVDCGDLQLPTNGVINLTSATFNNSASYSCDTGYELVGNQTRTCLATGNWSGSEPSCNVNDCGPLISPSLGMVMFNQTTFGEMALYTCVNGYQLAGDSNRTCTASGMWSGTQPACQAVGCGELQSPTNGVINFTSTTFNNTASYSCDTGYELVGNQTRTCLATRNWSGSEPSCNVVDCGPLSPPTNGTVSVSTTTYQSAAQYSCDAGFFVVGDTVRECQSNGAWSDLAPLCISTVTSGPVTVDLISNEETVRLSLLIGIPLAAVFLIVLLVVIMCCCVWRCRKHATYSLDKYIYGGTDAGHVSSLDRNMGFTEPIEQPMYGIVADDNVPNIRLSMVTANTHTQYVDDNDASSSDGEQSEMQSTVQPLCQVEMDDDNIPNIRLSIVTANAHTQYEDDNDASSSDGEQCDMQSTVQPLCQGKMDDDNIPNVRLSIVTANAHTQYVDDNDASSSDGEQSEIQSTVQGEGANDDIRSSIVAANAHTHVDDSSDGEHSEIQSITFDEVF